MKKIKPITIKLIIKIFSYIYDEFKQELKV